MKPMGADCAVISGGESPHVGGTVLAVPREKSSRDGMTCDIWSITVPGHKDTILAEQAAKKICMSMLQPVNVTVGVHIDHATEDEIRRLCENTCEAVECFLREQDSEAEKKGDAQ